MFKFICVRNTVKLTIAAQPPALQSAEHCLLLPYSTQQNSNQILDLKKKNLNMKMFGLCSNTPIELVNSDRRWALRFSRTPAAFNVSCAFTIAEKI